MKSVHHRFYISYNSGLVALQIIHARSTADHYLISQMVKRKRDSIPALVLEVIAQVYELSGRRTQPWYIDRSTLDLGMVSDRQRTQGCIQTSSFPWRVAQLEAVAATGCFVALIV
jgi:hypothetical protein